MSGEVEKIAAIVRRIRPARVNWLLPTSPFPSAVDCPPRLRGVDIIGETARRPWSIVSEGLRMYGAPPAKAVHVADVSGGSSGEAIKHLTGCGSPVVGVRQRRGAILQVGNAN